MKTDAQPNPDISRGKNIIFMKENPDRKKSSFSNDGFQHF